MYVNKQILQKTNIMWNEVVIQQEWNKENVWGEQENLSHAETYEKVSNQEKNVGSQPKWNEYEVWLCACIIVNHFLCSSLSGAWDSLVIKFVNLKMFL